MKPEPGNPQVSEGVLVAQGNYSPVAIAKVRFDQGKTSPQ